ncbi:MAG: hypothetical protein NVS3B10_00250 [Polyangiales bacterium]
MNHDAMLLKAVPAAPLAPTKDVKRFGLQKARVGSEHVVRMGKLRGQFRTRPMHEARELFEAGKLKPICLSCRKTYESAADLMADHPSHAELVKLNETHVVAYWCDEDGELTPEAEQLVAQSEEAVANLPVNASERIRARTLIKRPERVPVGLVSDEI